MKIFKVEAEGDTIYIRATNQILARAQLRGKVGPIPDELLTWTEVDALPEGEEFL